MLVLGRLYRRGVPGVGWLLAEGLWLALFGAAFAVWLFPSEASLVAVFLVAIASVDSLERLLVENRRRIYEDGERPLRANLHICALLLALFAGTTVGFSLLGLFLPLDLVELLFAKQLEGYGANFPGLQFGGAAPLLKANLFVLFFFVIALFFRQGGVMLAVAWNAGVWGATCGWLARTWDGGPPLVEAWFRVAGTCLPHLALEAAAFVLAGLAGVFLSKGLLRHALDSEPVRSIATSAAALLAVAVGLVVLGAFWEALVAPHLHLWLISG